jgi:hypothetical protein
MSSDRNLKDLQMSLVDESRKNRIKTQELAPLAGQKQEDRVKH